MKTSEIYTVPYRWSTKWVERNKGDREEKKKVFISFATCSFARVKDSHLPIHPHRKKNDEKNFKQESGLAVCMNLYVWIFKVIVIWRQKRISFIAIIKFCSFYFTPCAVTRLESWRVIFFFSLLTEGTGYFFSEYCVVGMELRGKKDLKEIECWYVTEK